MKGLPSLGGSKVSVLAPSSGRNTHRPLLDSALPEDALVSPARVSDKELTTWPRVTACKTPRLNSHGALLDVT